MMKVLKSFVVFAVFATYAIANEPDAAQATPTEEAAQISELGNLENPLYLPKQWQFFSKTGFGLMYKRTDNTEANIKRDAAFRAEFPVIRIYEELGFGILDNLSIIGAFGYTDNSDDDRSGMHLGRLGLTFRALNGANTAGWIWDVYVDAHLGGVSAMSGDYSLAKGFKYDNYTNGRWGVYGGTKVGNTFGKVSVAAFFEVLQTFGNDNNKINMKPAKAEATVLAKTAQDGMDKIDAGVSASIPGGIATVAACIADQTVNVACPTVMAAYNGNVNGLKDYYETYQMASAGFQQAYGVTTLPDEASVNLKSTTEFNAGLKGLFQINDMISVGGHFTFKNHADNGVESISTKPSGDNAAIQAVVMENMAEQLENMHDGFNEFIFGIAVAAQVIPNLQAALFFERTLDDANRLSQNGTSNKAEIGVRLNSQF